MTRIEAILQSLGIEVASKRGNRAWSHCPYHDSEHPTTFFVRLSGKRSGQAWCFSCKSGGTIFDLVMHIRGCDFATAKAFVQSVGQGFDPPKAKVSVVARPPDLGRAKFKMPSEVIFEPFEYWIPSVQKYARSRSITEEEVETFKLGYAVDGSLACRMVIPWLGKGGVVAGYSARSFVDEEPKYKTPKESDNADFGVMVGEHLWPDPRHRGIVVVTEGALNGFAIRRVLKTINSKVSIAALGGSEINPTHIIKLSTFGLVLVMTDPDAAGDKAAQSIMSSLSRHTPTRRVRLPENTDALDVGPAVLTRIVDNALRGCA